MTMTLLRNPTARAALTQWTVPSGRPSPDFQPFACSGPHPAWPERRCKNFLVEVDISRPCSVRTRCCDRCREKTVIGVTEAMAWE